MENKDYLFPTKGRAVCLMLNSARGVLSEMIFEDEVSKVIVKDCCANLLDVPINR